MIVLGSTGSIGTQTLALCAKHGVAVEALSCQSNATLLNEQIAKFHPKFVTFGGDKSAIDMPEKRVFGDICEMLSHCESQRVVNALVGFAGLAPSIMTQRLGKTLYLANKESLVVAGRFLRTREIMPIDSEHFGLKFLLAGHENSEISRLIITASGGALANMPIRDLPNAAPSDALRHPNWSMGAKITIDSATMANKLFEVLEAFWLYGVRAIDAMIERTSSVHALVEFDDGSVSAHFAVPDMGLPIAHAILPAGEVGKFGAVIDPINLFKNEIKFSQIDTQRYPIFALKDDIINNPNLGVIINASNEIFVQKFLNNECKFTDLTPLVMRCIERFESERIESLDDIFDIDARVRAYCKECL